MKIATWCCPLLAMELAFYCAKDTIIEFDKDIIIKLH